MGLLCTLPNYLRRIFTFLSSVGAISNLPKTAHFRKGFILFNDLYHGQTHTKCSYYALSLSLSLKLLNSLRALPAVFMGITTENIAAVHDSTPEVHGRDNKIINIQQDGQKQNTELLSFNIKGDEDQRNIGVGW